MRGNQSKRGVTIDDVGVSNSSKRQGPRVQERGGGACCAGTCSCSGICLAIHRLKMLHEMMQAGGHQKRGARCDGKIPIQLEREICKVMDQGGREWRGATEARLGRYDDIVRLFTGESGVMRLGA